MIMSISNGSMIVLEEISLQGYREFHLLDNGILSP